ncbi:fimbrial biogenesis chaperone [Pseudomonas sp. S2_C03]
MPGITPLPAIYRYAAGLCMLLMLLAHIPAAEAALSISATRVVFGSDKRSTSVIISNPSNRPFAVQTWVNTASDDDTTAVPFMPSPPLFRLNPGKEQQVQINGLPNALPTDRESLFYFNVQEIPQAQDTDGNVLNIALRTRIKLFYRPVQLKDNPMSRLKDLEWSVRQVGGQVHLVVHNPTPFHVSFTRVDVSGNGQKQAVQNPAMVEPMKQQHFVLDTIRPSQGLQVTFSAINDFGGFSTPLSVPVQPAP